MILTVATETVLPIYRGKATLYILQGLGLNMCFHKTYPKFPYQKPKAGAYSNPKIPDRLRAFYARLLTVFLISNDQLHCFSSLPL